MKPSIEEFRKTDGNTMSYYMHGIKTIARIRVEENVDLVLKKMKLKICGQPYDEVLLTPDKRLLHLKANEDRIIRNGGLVFWKFYGEIGNINYYQILVPTHLVGEVLRSLHGEVSRHPEITKTIIG